MHFTLKQLQHLVLLADELNFARAADRAALSQSAFSRSIQMLESGVGVRLFDRDVKHVQPTPLGERMIARARALLADTGDLAREMTLLSSGDLGNIAMGAGALAGAVVLPGPLALLRQAHPEVRVDIDVIESNTLLDKLLRAGLDFFTGECSAVPYQSDLCIEPLGRMHVKFFSRADHPLAMREVVNLNDLAAYGLASVHIPATFLQPLFGRISGGRGSTPELSLQCGSLTILRDYVLGSDAVLLGAERPFRVEIEQGLLVPLRVREFDSSEAGAVISVDLSLAYLANRTPTPAGQLLMDMIREEAQTALAASSGKRR